MPLTELIKKRTRNSKTYDIGGGRRRCVFHGSDVHYKDSDGHWQDIDANFSEVDGDGFTARFTKLPYAVRMGDDGRRRLYPDRNDLSYWVEIGKPFPSMGMPTKQGGYWVWDYPNAAISLRISSVGIKLNFTLKNFNAPTSISFPFAVEGITRSGRALLHDGEPVVILARPYAVDAEGTKRDVDISFAGGEVTLSLDTSELVFPIDVDPTELVIQPSAKDATLSESVPDTNFGAIADISIAPLADYVMHSILEFDISGVPGGQTLISASLELYYREFDFGDPVGKTVWAYKLTRTDWIELEATWNIYKTGSGWSSAGGDYVTVAPVGGSTVAPAGFGWMAWDVLAIVQDAYDGSIAAEFLVKILDEASDVDAVFWSNNYLPDPGLCPKLTIEYEPAAPVVEKKHTFRLHPRPGHRMKFEPNLKLG